MAKMEDTIEDKGQKDSIKMLKLQVVPMKLSKGVGFESL